MKGRNVLRAVVVWLVGVAPVAAEVRQAIHFPDLPGYRTLKCDLHMHTVFSDGKVWPTVRVDEAWREGLDAIAITDHIEYLAHKAFVTADFNAAYEIALPRAKEKNILLVKGVEITRDTPPGHFNLLFIRDGAPFNTADIFAVFDRAAQQNAYVMWNHPGWRQRPRWGEVQSRLAERKQLKAIEVCNGDEYYPEAFQWAIEKNLAVIGCTDIHDPSLSPAPTPALHRTLTLVFARERSLEGLREALEAGRTLVWFENCLMGREQYASAMFDACVRIHPPHHRTRDRLHVEIENASELNIELERIGDAGPAKITLPARAISLVEIALPTGDPPPLAYRTRNFLIGPDRPLPVNLSIPAAGK